MERVFTQDVLAANGVVKFAAGERREYPQTTWLGIASSAEMDLDEFTSTPEQIAVKMAANDTRRRKVQTKSSDEKTGLKKKSKKSKKSKSARRKILMN